MHLLPDANSLRSVTDHCLRSRNNVNVIVAGKRPSPQWLDMEAAVRHCTGGLAIWPWASTDQGGEPDVVMACCGDVPLETLAAVSLLRERFPELRVRVIKRTEHRQYIARYGDDMPEVRNWRWTAGAPSARMKRPS